MVDWKGWINKSVFIKLDDGTVFSHSKVIAYEEPFLSILDLFKLPVVINVKNITRIVEEKNG